VIPRIFVVLLAVLYSGIAQAGTTAHVENATKPTRCAETDNVYMKFSGAGISHFTIEARHPSYLHAMAKDENAPNFTACDQTHDPSFRFEPLDTVLFQDDEYRLVGHRYPTFWRPQSVDFRIGDTVTNGLHLIQLLRKMKDGRWIELLVLYPPDGYWRLKPLTPEGMAETLYGSSFLIGPIAEDGRPYLALSSVTFDRKTLSFHLGFRTGKGVLRVTETSTEHTVVSVDLPPASGSAPWAALRSMFVSPTMADATFVTAWPVGQDAQTARVMDFEAADALSVMFGRPFPSHHNTSAPDLIFGNFTH
jgi:hypothetical protein